MKYVFENEAGQFHREDGPAFEYDNGDKEWYLNGQQHREDGPAVEYGNGYKEWWLNGKLHRVDGPAVEHNNGYKAWYLNGININCSSQKEFEQLIKLKAFW